jgi:hypothetical protein
MIRRLTMNRLARRVFIFLFFAAASPVGAQTPNLHAIPVGAASGYTDVSPKQIVRTSDNFVYIVATNCDAYPCMQSSQTVRVWKADSPGAATSFSRLDSAHEPVDAGSVAAAIDATDTIHIVWQDRNGASNTRIRYATFRTSLGTWGTQESLETNVSTASDTGQGDHFVALALDANGKPHVTFLYYDGARRRVAYRHRVSGLWSVRTFIDNNTYGPTEQAWLPNIAFDSAGRRVFAWLTGGLNGDSNGVIRVRVMDTDGTFGVRADVSTATAKVGIDQSTSLLCDGRIHITWILGAAAGGEFVRYAYAAEGKNPVFTANHPADAATHNPSLGPGPDGTIRIYGPGSEAPNDDSLYYWEGTGGAGSWSGRNPYSDGAFDSSVSTRWSQYFFAYPQTLDIAYWNQNYPNDLYYGADGATLPLAAPTNPRIVN